MKIIDASSPFGRIVLHLLCIAQSGRHASFHLAGIMREIRKTTIAQSAKK